MDVVRQDESRVLKEAVKFIETACEQIVRLEGEAVQREQNTQEQIMMLEQRVLEGKEWKERAEHQALRADSAERKAGAAEKRAAELQSRIEGFQR